jgi:hypothetical protein
MQRRVLLVLINLAFALVLAASLLPGLLVLFPLLQSEPAAGYVAGAILTAALMAMNAALYRRWLSR